MPRNLSRYIDTFLSRGFNNCITIPTWITSTSTTSFDQILYDSKKISGLNGTIDSNQSDHLPVFLNIDFPKHLPSKNNSSFKPILSVQNTALFKNLLSSCGWNSVLSSHNTELAFNTFHNVWRTCFEQCFPLKKT